MENPMREGHKKSIESQQGAKAMVFAGIVLVALGFSTYFLKQAFIRPLPAFIAGNVVDIKADMNGYDQKEVQIKVGEPVTIRLTSMDNSLHTDGGGKHQWAVDELNISIIAQPQQSNYITFVPDKPGRYTFYCDICCGGRANPSMSGTLVVQGKLMTTLNPSTLVAVPILVVTPGLESLDSLEFRL